MTEPRDGRAPAAGDSGRLRASHADREQAVEALKDAFVEDRLTKDELDMRVSRALAARTGAELAALTADLPAGSAAALPPRQSAGAQNRAPRSHTARDVAIGSGIGLGIAAAIVLGGLLNAVALLGLLALPILAVALVLIVASHSSSQQRRSRGQLPPRPGPGGQAPQIQQPGQAGESAVPPGPRTDQTRADQTRADLRTHGAWRHRSPSSGQTAQVPRGIWPIPDVT
jgi:Domain of unknown function (DUF1707)